MTTVANRVFYAGVFLVSLFSAKRDEQLNFRKYRPQNGALGPCIRGALSRFCDWCALCIRCHNWLRL